MRAGVALGSNLGDRLGQLQLAREKILRLSGVTAPFLFSALYETEPVGCEATAGKFLNATLELGFEDEPGRLLRQLRTIEISLGRKPDHERNLSRTIDLDLLYFGDTMIDRPELQLPHPRMHLRRFVLVPLADIRPDLILPTHTEPVHVLLARLVDKSAVVRVADEW
jgi:2-amino-4-hydroxy-6-hydroxymethyldihydropteridine diphosphokinase